MHRTLRVTLRPRPDLVEPVLRLAAAHLPVLGCRDGDVVRLRVPGRAVRVRVQASPQVPPGFADLPPAVVRRLRLAGKQALQVRSAGGNALDIGPFVGIVAPARRGHLIFGPQGTFFARLLRMARSMHVGAYVMTHADADVARAAVRAWVLAGGRWVRRPRPLPHVLYDRSNLVRATLKLQSPLRRFGVRLFNSPVGSKWWVYRLLQRDPLMARYLPETRLIRGSGDLRRLLARHPSVYVKPIHGGKGRGIWKVRRARAGGWAYLYTDQACNIHRGRVWDPGFLVRRWLRTHRPYIAQQGLDLLRWQGRIFDVRVLVQKDGLGQWRVTGTGIRIGRPGSIVSNLHGGGRAGIPDSAYLADRRPLEFASFLSGFAPD